MPNPATLERGAILAIYSELLSREGYRPEKDADGDLIFKYEGNRYMVICDEADPFFFQLCCPNFWRIDSADEAARALDAANTTSRDTKVAKIAVRSDGKNVWGFAEAFVIEPEDIANSLDRLLRALGSAVNSFIERMQAES